MHSKFNLKHILDNWFDFLFDKGEFSKESLTQNYNDDSVCILTSDKIKLRFINERSQFFLDIASTHQPDNYEDIHLVKYLLTGEGYNEGLLNEMDAYFVKQYKEQIEILFSKKNIESTLKKIDEIKAKRANDRWGPTLEDFENQK